MARYDSYGNMLADGGYGIHEEQENYNRVYKAPEQSMQAKLNAWNPELEDSAIAEGLSSEQRVKSMHNLFQHMPREKSSVLTKLLKRHVNNVKDMNTTKAYAAAEHATMNAEGFLGAHIAKERATQKVIQSGSRLRNLLPEVGSASSGELMSLAEKLI